MDATTTLPFALDYGLENGPIVYAKDMGLDDFVTKITTVDLNYNFQNMDKNYDTSSFWGDLANTTEDVVADTSGFVWDTAKGTWDTVKSGAQSVANAVDSAGTKLLDTGSSIFDGILMRVFAVIAVLVVILVILGKTGVLKDIGGIVGAALRP